MEPGSDFESGAVAPTQVGRRAFEAELARLARNITVGADDALAREAGRSLARARRSVQAGDYLGAVEALGRLDLTIREVRREDNPSPPNAGQVEEALADVRRRLAEAELTEEHEGGVLLWQAARQSVIDGRWESALALLEEAREWVARATRPGR